MFTRHTGVLLTSFLGLLAACGKTKVKPPVVDLRAAGDTVLGGADVLDYGQSAQRGQFTCTSSQAGVTCKDAGTGHGFDLSRQAYRLY